SGRFAAFAPPVVLDPVTPGEQVAVRVTAAVRGPVPVTIRDVVIKGPSDVAVRVTALDGRPLASQAPLSERVPLAIPADAPLTRPYFTRPSIAQTRYDVVDDSAVLRPFAPPAFRATMTYEIDGVPATLTTPVVRREAQLPYGHALRELDVLPPVTLGVGPSRVALPLGETPRPLEVRVEALAHARDGASGTLRLEVPAGWRVTPASAPFSLASAGARARQVFT